MPTLLLPSLLLCPDVIQGAECTRRVAVFIDQTSSAGDGHRATWNQHIKALSAELKPGDCTFGFPLHDGTRNAAPLFMKTVPANQPGAPMQVQLDVRARQQRVRSEVSEALIQAVEQNVKANATDAFGLVDRVPSGEGSAVVVVLSDMEQSNMEGDFERAPPKGAAIPVMIRRIAEKHHWTASSLKGARFIIITPPSSLGRPGNANNRQAVKEFWLECITSLGGSVVSYDTYFDFASRGL